MCWLPYAELIASGGQRRRRVWCGIHIFEYKKKEKKLTLDRFKQIQRITSRTSPPHIKRNIQTRNLIHKNRIVSITPDELQIKHVIPQHAGVRAWGRFAVFLNNFRVAGAKQEGSTTCSGTFQVDKCFSLAEPRMIKKLDGSIQVGFFSVVKEEDDGVREPSLDGDKRSDGLVKVDHVLSLVLRYAAHSLVLPTSNITAVAMTSSVAPGKRHNECYI
jgi:hypothetical protein